ncbi:MAG: coenzyme F420-0:L-glutamate ligase [Candidatus Hydrothermarchaeota archaeon]
MNEIKILPIRTGLIKIKDDLVDKIMEALSREKIEIEDGDVLVIAETAVSLTQSRIVRLEDVSFSKEAEKLAKEYEMDPRVVEVILNEADEVYGGVKYCLLTKKNGFLIANAGVDHSNAPLGHVILFPDNIQYTANKIREKIENKTGKKIGVIIGDSRTQPLKKGVVGGALAVSGLEPVEDNRGKKDLYGRELKITFRAIADDLTSAAQLLMGESDECIPAVLIKGAKVRLTDNPKNDMFISPEECLFFNVFWEKKS